MEPLTALSSLAATRKFARTIASSLVPGSVLAIVGDLGAGKTTFVQALAKALGVLEPSEVLSPTYTLVNEYPLADGLLVHLDLYRLVDIGSAIALGLDEQLHRRDAVVVVEWADKFPDLLPAGATWLHLIVDEAGRRAELRTGP
ncbi:MAG: tRNA (adenosine(37)-N6)-threonylcarbamoyltransferase complex ATPase subunit type 1 TsaE [Clostridia bacterium]|nr:tRNA (adenosine(37)-N6)-threonylcarbamoyltransferase complex ATPase subunit type 1 TsaE [Deltaproteobacteria bacterium]